MGGCLSRGAGGLTVPKSKGLSAGLGKLGLQNPCWGVSGHRSAQACVWSWQPHRSEHACGGWRTGMLMPSGHSDHFEGTSRSGRVGVVRRGTSGNLITLTALRGTGLFTLGGRCGAVPAQGDFRWPWGWHDRGVLGAGSKALDTDQWV